jgi:hypothetical protein
MDKKGHDFGSETVLGMRGQDECLTTLPAMTPLGKIAEGSEVDDGKRPGSFSHTRSGRAEVKILERQALEVPA